MHIIATPVRKNMETEDIEDGEILEDESNSNDATFQNHNEILPEFNTFEQKPPRIEANNYDIYLPHKEKRNHRHESHKRRERSSFSDIPRKRRRMDDDNGCIRGDKLYYEKKNKCNFDDAPMKNYDEEDTDDDMIFVLGGSLRDTERMPKSGKKHFMITNDMVDSMMHNEGENEDPRPFSKRSPLRREKFKKDRDRNMSRGPERCQVGMAKRRGRGGGGGGIPRRGKPRDDHDGGYSQGKGPRGNDCGGYVHNYNQPRKLEVCKFYLNDCCTKRDKCIYMHSDFPCKYHHTPGLTCHIGKNCKFSHSKLDEIQRAVLKKYADISLKEVDEMQRYYRENSGNATYSAHKEKKEQASSNVQQNSRIPSLFDVKVTVPPEFRGKEDGEEGGSTPMPSPQSASQMYDEEENSESYDKKYKHNNVLLEQNDHTESEETDRKISSEEDGHRSHHKKRSKKSDDYSDNERRHSDRHKKRSRKEDRKSEKDRKNKHEPKEVQNSYSDLFPELEEPPWDLEDNTEEPAVPEPIPPSAPLAATPPPAIIEEQESPKHEQKEAADALSHLPKKQQELFLRIQQHQKEAETSQNANIDEKEDEDDGKQDVNWYSSDEEEESEKTQPENSSPLATILRTIKTNTTNVPNDQKPNNNRENTLNTYMPRATTNQETDAVVVDASQLANIDLSDEVTQLLTSIMKTDASTTQHQISSYSLPITKEPQSIVSQSALVSRRSSDERSYRFDGISDTETSKEDVDLRYINANNILNSTSLFANNQESNPNKDIDFRTLPFKPVPIHDAATEIDASITSHPPMEYKLKPLPFIPRVNYAALVDMAKMCPNDPRFKRKLHLANTESMDTTHLIPPFVPQDPRQALAVKTINESRADPRLADPRKMDRHDPRLDGKVIPNSKLDQRPDPRIVESKVPDKEQVRPIADYRDPRLKGCKFPEVPSIPFPMITPIPPPIVPEMAQMPLRKEDPRLRFRANQK